MRNNHFTSEKTLKIFCEALINAMGLPVKIVDPSPIRYLAPNYLVAMRYRLRLGFAIEHPASGKYIIAGYSTRRRQMMIVTDDGYAFSPRRSDMIASLIAFVLRASGLPIDKQVYFYHDFGSNGSDYNFYAVKHPDVIAKLRIYKQGKLTVTPRSFKEFARKIARFCAYAAL